MGNILLVDDDADFAAVLGEVLRAEGHRVTTARDGEEAMELLPRLSPDLIVTDVMLPAVDGWKLCKRVKRMPSGRGVPVLVISAREEEMAQLMSYESGADVHLCKPFRNEDFTAAVQRLLERSGAAAR